MSAAKRRRKHKARKRLHRRPGPRLGATVAATARAERRLREAIQEFAFQPRFGEECEQALAQFFGEEVIRTRTLVADEEEIPEFQEWYFFDYVTSSGETIIDMFAREKGPKLSEKERELLDLWRRWNRYRLFEVQKVMPGTGVVVEDLLSGETLEVHDRSASRSLTRWSIFLARPLYTDRLHFTGAGTPLSPLKKQAVLDYSRQLLADFQARHPQATMDEFYRRHGLDIRHFMRRKAEERPVWITPEGHPLEFCTAYYRVADDDAVAERLDLAEEFNFAGPSADHPGALHFNWLLRGRSHVPEQPKPKGEVLVYHSQWFLEPGSPKYRSLGDVALWPDRLELSCLSRARLEAGKALLETLLGSLIRHRRDRIESMEEFLAHQPPAPRRQRLPPDVAEAFQQDALREEFENWADEPREALGGKTAREAVREPEGRAKVIEILKIAEYIQEQRRQAGEPWYDVNLIRRELGLPIP
ncbi:MAG TPA: hypothetical protein EYP55_01260 [Anaerolineae bacterium]|nr:hypothetical protein [Anaerolineae bacterium]